ncbi:hypothetical protein EMIHUDRAFT_444486 [Emiliania huxleyi CCMP1516]|uniref:Mitochondrial proton/calcium exchanger protein n=2 Tax=Emiliania huxleyi TaxID=2903 RepID=A0A0D3JCY7_EMIH1|nr:hypothetical protein EMIHUDRAFT_444486 [Emiliania huxleyi CCMP1516]EOD21372.1 hypothetical protein EMIHUDRAFT_444486 [Emiliania huxleyi CCMP1516]|eukprot:XP_005773801.1 hypothetical protein EMIHUDRAFT_444486 [Emiliania huxleyi CCMP1516]
MLTRRALLRRSLQVQRALLRSARIPPASLRRGVVLLPRRPPLLLHSRALASKSKSEKAPPPARWSPQWVWDHAKEMASHYWHGSKLLAADTRIASQLLVKMMRGRVLSRREHSLLVRVLGDLLRVIPLAFFLLVPMMEFALPFAIRLFPNLLPSTFEEKHQIEEKRIKLLKVRLEVAKVLEHTLEERAKELNRATKAKAEAGGGDAEEPYPRDLFSKFMRRMREGERLSREETLQVMSHFKHVDSPDALNRQQLTLLCNFLGMPSFGPDPVLRFQLRTKLRQLRNDDKEIMWEGVGSLTRDELLAAMRARGLPSAGLGQAQMAAALQEWLQLSQNREIPSVLLLLSNALRFARVRDYQQEAQAEREAAAASKVLDDEAAQVALSSMREEVIDSAGSGAAKGAATTTKEALASLEREAELVEEERQLKRAGVDKVPSSVRPAEAVTWSGGGSGDKAAAEKASPAAADGAATAEEVEEEEATRLSREQVRDIAAAVETLSATSALEGEKKEWQKLEAERLESATEIEEAKAQGSAYIARMLDSRVRVMMDSLRTEIEEADGSIGASLHAIDLDGDGVLSYEELMLALESMNKRKRPHAEQMKQVLEQLDPDSDGKIQLADLRQLISEMELRDEDPPAEKKSSSSAE